MAPARDITADSKTSKFKFRYNFRIQQEISRRMIKNGFLIT